MQTQALALPRRSQALAATDRRSDDAAPIDGVVCLADDTPLTVGLLRELLKEAAYEMFARGNTGFRWDLALLNTIEDRMPNPWA